jgi:hypothetical protein
MLETASSSFLSVLAALIILSPPFVLIAFVALSAFCSDNNSDSDEDDDASDDEPVDAAEDPTESVKPGQMTKEMA